MSITWQSLDWLWLPFKFSCQIILDFPPENLTVLLAAVVCNKYSILVLFGNICWSQMISWSFISFPPCDDYIWTRIFKCKVYVKFTFSDKISILKPFSCTTNIIWKCALVAQNSNQTGTMFFWKIRKHSTTKYDTTDSNWRDNIVTVMADIKFLQAGKVGNIWWKTSDDVITQRQSP